MSVAETTEWNQEVMDIHKSVDSEIQSQSLIVYRMHLLGCYEILEEKPSSTWNKETNNVIISCIYPNKLWFLYILKGLGAEKSEI